MNTEPTQTQKLIHELTLNRDKCQQDKSCSHGPDVLRSLSWSDSFHRQTCWKVFVLYFFTSLHWKKNRCYERRRIFNLFINIHVHLCRYISKGWTSCWQTSAIALVYREQAPGFLKTVQKILLHPQRNSSWSLVVHKTFLQQLVILQMQMEKHFFKKTTTNHLFLSQLVSLVHLLTRSGWLCVLYFPVLSFRCVLPPFTPCVVVLSGSVFALSIPVCFLPFVVCILFKM